MTLARMTAPGDVFVLQQLSRSTSQGGDDVTVQGGGHGPMPPTHGRDA